MKEKEIQKLYKECSDILAERNLEVCNLVLGSGNYNAKILFLAQSPSLKEEGAGFHFVGKTGDNFEGFLSLLGLSRDDVYITTIIKCRPYRVNDEGKIVNRPVDDNDVNFFLPYLKKEIEIIDPKIIITLGNNPLKIILEDDNLLMNKEAGKLRKKYINNIEYKVYPMYHPSALIYNETSQSDNSDLEVLQDLVELYYREDNVTEDKVHKKDYKILPKKEAITLANSNPSKKSYKLKTIIIYGGDGYADDPTLVALDRISNVLTELNVNIHRLDLYKGNINVDAFFEELKTAGGVIIGTTVEWFGMGGLLQSFLDKCWKHGDSLLFEQIYLFGVVISKQAFERDTYNSIIKSWELLGGVEGLNICSSISDSADLETNTEMLDIIDKKAEDYYRILNQRRPALPTSIKNSKIYVEVPVAQENHEQISFNELLDDEPKKRQAHDNQATLISNYDEYIEKQQRDIEDIANIFKKKISNKVEDRVKTICDVFNDCYSNNHMEINATIQLLVNNSRADNIVIILNNSNIKCINGQQDDVDVTIACDKEVLNRITEGRLTVQRAFMTGEITAKGNFTIIYKFDSLFDFK
jgi:uracil-DNA glycosylase family 4